MITDPVIFPFIISNCLLACSEVPYDSANSLSNKRKYNTLVGSSITVLLSVVVLVLNMPRLTCVVDNR